MDGKPVRRLFAWLVAAARGDGGVSTVLLALTLPALLGMQAIVIDGTRLFVERRELQNAVDAAALAAARHLPTTDGAVLALATDDAIDYAARNGVTIQPGDVLFAADQEPYDRVTIRAQSQVSFTFALGLGVSFGAVGSQGTAQIGNLGGVAGVAPWGLEEPDGGFEFGEEYCLKLGSTSGGCSGARQGNFQALDIDDIDNSSASVYREKIKHGSQSVVKVGDTKSVVQGNMVGPTQQGVGCTGNAGLLTGNTSTFEQVVQDLGDSYLVTAWHNSRIVIVPTVEFPEAHLAEVTGFALFFIEECGGNGSVTGRFIDTVVPAANGAVWMPFSGGHGTKIARLVD